jgi:hypothetical protein
MTRILDCALRLRRRAGPSCPLRLEVVGTDAEHWQAGIWQILHRYKHVFGPLWHHWQWSVGGSKLSGRASADVDRAEAAGGGSKFKVAIPKPAPARRASPGHFSGHPSRHRLGLVRTRSCQCGSKLEVAASLSLSGCRGERNLNLKPRTPSRRTVLGDNLKPECRRFRVASPVVAAQSLASASCGDHRSVTVSGIMSLASSALASACY